MSNKEILEQQIQTIKALGEKSKLAIIPYSFIFPWLIITAFSFFLYQGLLLFWAIDEAWLIIAIIWLCAAWSLIAGENSHNLTDEFYPLPGFDWIDTPTYFIPATETLFRKKMGQKLKSVVDKTPQGYTSSYSPFQNESHLHGIMKISVGDDSFAVILRCNQQLEWSATVPFALGGLHSQMSEGEIINQCDAISDALLGMPLGENITFAVSRNSSRQKRKSQLDESLEVDNPILETIKESEKIKVDSITNSGLRQISNHYVLVSWSQKNQNRSSSSNAISEFINSLEILFSGGIRKLIGTDKNYWRNIYINLAQNIYNNCYLPWKIRLQSKGKLSISSLNPDQVWSDLLWKRFRKTLPKYIPQVIDVFATGSGQLDYQIYIHNPINPKDLTSKLIEAELGRSSCPTHNQRRDRIKVKNQLVGILNLSSPPESVKLKDQLYWLFEKISEPTFRDLDVFLELNPKDIDEARTNLKRLVRQSTGANEYAKHKGNVIDVGATKLSDQALAAQERLESGAEPLLAALTILVYRKTDKELKSVCTRLIESFSTASLVRESKVCWKRWLETLPINNHSILASTEIFSDPRSTVDTISVRSILPLIRPKNIHENGVEFIAEGGYPVYINLIENTQRAIITGQTGSGKTVMAFGHIKQALLKRDRAVVGIDMSNAGDSTLKPITELLGEEGAFINLSEHSFNVLQPPDLRKYHDKERQKRFNIWLDSVRQIIVSMSMGEIQNPQLYETVTSIVTLTLNIFFQDSEIIRRYNEALDQGWKSRAWQKMPVLEDFLFFCSRSKLGLTDFGEKQARAREQIVTSISAKLVDPNIGKCISQPSTVSPNARLQFFGLSGLSDPSNAYILSLVAQSACLNIALEYEKSLVVLDECPALFAKKGFAELVGQQFSLGRKEGVSALLIGQTIEAIFNSSASSSILDNTDFFFTGKLGDEAANFFHERLKFPEKIVRPLAGDTYGIDKIHGYSNWLITHNGRYWHTKYFPSDFELAGLANSKDEKKLRNQILQQYPNTPQGQARAIAEFAYRSKQLKKSKN